jgi:hypothetical protein
VEQGIDTISVTPDSFFKTVKAISQIEKSLKPETEEYIPSIAPLSHIEMPQYKTAN